MNILHLSQTDIRCDSRILKEMHAVAGFSSSIQLYGIGINLGEQPSKMNGQNSFYIKTISLRSKKIAFVPKIIIHIFSVLEIMLKMFFEAKKLKPHIIHCHDTPVLPVGVLLKIISGVKVIYDAHELESNRNGISELSGKMTLLAEKLMWCKVDALIVVSRSIEKWYHKNIGEKYSAVILNSPIIENNSEYDSHYFRNKFHIPINTKIFLYIGILGPGRGIDLMINAFVKSDVNSHLVFLGFGKMQDELRELTKRCLNIHVHDAVPHDKVVSVAKSADVGMCLIQNVSLSDYYCLPNKLFEYCFAGIRVLASDFPEISRTVEKFNLGQCCQLDSESIYGAIKKIESSEERPMIDVGSLYDLSWDAQIEKLSNLYSELMVA